MTDFTREQLETLIECRKTSPHYCNTDPADLAAFALALLDRAEKAEKRMKAWGCPDFDFICLNCGRETPCITEADLRPGDPGVPCTFDLTYPQMIERLHHYEDRQRKAEAERDRLLEELLGAKVAWDMCDAVNRGLREELREAEEAIREAIEELSDGVTFEDERVSYVEMQVGREWRIEWLQSPAVRRARERAK